MISCLGAPTRHLLIPRDPFQLSFVVTSQYSKTFSLEKFPENPLSHSPKVCLYGLTMSNTSSEVSKTNQVQDQNDGHTMAPYIWRCTVFRNFQIIRKIYIFRLFIKYLCFKLPRSFSSTVYFTGATKLEIKSSSNVINSVFLGLKSTR